VAMLFAGVFLVFMSSSDGFKRTSAADTAAKAVPTDFRF